MRTLGCCDGRILLLTKAEPLCSIVCNTQEEIDYFWEKLSADGGESGQCGWINHDKYGVTWQVVPEMLDELLGDSDGEKSARAMKAMLSMTKLNIAELQKAHAGK